MKYTIKKLPKSQVELVFEVPFEEVEKNKKQVLEKIGKELKVEGFRPGHVPPQIVEREVGQMAILEEASELAVKESYQKAILENNFEPIGQPQVAVTKLAQGNPFEFKVTVPLLPEIKLPDYKKIAGESKKKEIAVSEKDMEDSLSFLRKSRAKTSLKGAPSQKGDFVELEYSSPQIEGGKKVTDAFVLGEARMVPGFETNLENMKDSEEKTFSVRFPGDYFQKDLAGKEVSFNVKIKSVHRVEFPELNEIMEKVIKDSVCDIPDVLIEAEKHRMIHELEDRLAQSNVPLADYLSKIKKTEKELEDSFSPEAEKRVKASLALREMSNIEKIEVSEEEIKEEVNNFLKQYPDVNAAQSKFDAERLKEYTKEAIRNEKTFKLLESLVK
jgi:trigger factor